MDILGDIPYNSDIYSESLYEALFILREKVITLEKDNLELKNALDNMRKLKEQLETTLFDNSTCLQKKVRKQTNKSTEELQFLSFYRRNKDNPNIIEKLKTDLMSIGYDGSPPWQLIKRECIIRFALLSEEEKIEYLS